MQAIPPVFFQCSRNGLRLLLTLSDIRTRFAGAPQSLGEPDSTGAGANSRSLTPDPRTGWSPQDDRRRPSKRKRFVLPRHQALPHPRRSRTITFTLEYVRGGRLGRSSAVRGVARQSPVVAGGLAWKVTPDRDGSFRPLIEMCSRTCRCVKVCRRNHPDEPTAHGRTVWTKRSG